LNEYGERIEEKDQDGNVKMITGNPSDPNDYLLKSNDQSQKESLQELYIFEFSEGVNPTKILAIRHSHVKLKIFNAGFPVKTPIIPSKTRISSRFIN
jgi:hypothetical protein